MRLSQLAFTAGILGLAGLIRPAAAVEVSYLFELSDFNGTVPYGDVNLHVDRGSDELYAGVGDEVRDCCVHLVTDGTDDGDLRVENRSGQNLLVEGPQVL